MTRIEAMTAFSALDTPALYAEMQRRGIASPDFDAACKWAEKVCDRIAKTSAATLATMTDWRQVLDHASGKDKPQRSADDLPADIVGTWYDVEFNAPGRGAADRQGGWFLLVPVPQMLAAPDHKKGRARGL